MPELDAIKTRALGEFAVFPVGFGCMNLSHGYDGQLSFQDASHLLNYVLDCGVNLLDTAALYGGGANEELLGKAVMHRRSEFILASKCVVEIRDGKRVLDGRPEAILSSLDRSLKRLRTDCIDLAYMHRLDRQVPVEDSIGALVRAKEAGKIRAIGLSEVSADTLIRAHAVHPVAAVQNDYSPMTRNPEVALLDACGERGVALVAFAPLGRGMLTGKVTRSGFGATDIRSVMPRFNPPFVALNLAIADRFAEIARGECLTTAQLALAWVLARGRNVIPIPGTTSITHFDENISAASIELAKGVVDQVDKLFLAHPIQGARHTPQLREEIDTELCPGEDMRF